MDRPPLPPLIALLATQMRTRWAEEMTSDWAYVVFYRPLAVPLAWVLAHTAATPMAVTLAGGVSIPAMIAAALLLPPEFAVATIGGIAWIGGLLDCVDGDLARLTGRTSWLGRYVDFQIDVIRWATLFVATGHAADRAAASGGVWLAVGALAAWLRLFARAARDYRAGTLGRTPKPAAAPRRRTLAELGAAFVAGLDGLLPIVAVAAGLAGRPAVALLLPLALAGLDAVVTQAANLRLYARR